MNNTIKNYQKWLRAEIKLLRDDDDAGLPLHENQYEEVAASLRAAKKRAVEAGRPNIAGLCSRPTSPTVTPANARGILADCLRQTKITPDFLTPPQVAKRYGVSPEAVRGWIITGKLAALNIGKKVRPRYRIAQEALSAFNARQMPNVVPPTPPQRRPKPVKGRITRY